MINKGNHLNKKKKKKYYKHTANDNTYCDPDLEVYVHVFITPKNFCCDSKKICEPKVLLHSTEHGSQRLCGKKTLYNNVQISEAEAKFLIFRENDSI